MSKKFTSFRFDKPPMIVWPNREAVDRSRKIANRGAAASNRRRAAEKRLKNAKAQ